MPLRGIDADLLLGIRLPDVEVEVEAEAGTGTAVFAGSEV